MAQSWQEVRVFISSTFRDMQAERDHLVRFVFPRLREELARRRIRLVDVDLRWGVTADQDAFDLCMREIENCHPRFLCMLGGRYGWVPPPAVIAAEFMGRLRTGESPAGALTADELALLDRIYPGRDDSGNSLLLARPGTVDEVNRYSYRSTSCSVTRLDSPKPRARFLQETCSGGFGLDQELRMIRDLLEE